MKQGHQLLSNITQDYLLSTAREREKEESKIAMDDVCDMHRYSYCKGIVWNLEIPCVVVSFLTVFL